MNEAERQLLRVKSVDLMRNIKCSADFLNIFVAENVISETDKEMVEARITSNEKVSDLLSYLQCRSRGLGVLLKALQVTNQSEALSILDPNQKVVETRSTSEMPKQCTYSVHHDSSKDVLVVGDEDCEIMKIVNVVDEHADGHKLLDELGTVARKLNIPAEERAKCKTDSQGDKQDKLDVFEAVLTCWAVRRGKQATLLSLIAVLEKLNFTEIVESLKIEFEL